MRRSRVVPLCIVLHPIATIVPSHVIRTTSTRLYLWGLRRDAEQCIERDGVIQYRVNGQSWA